jgi:hypothetical protein
MVFGISTTSVFTFTRRVWLVASLGLYLRSVYVFHLQRVFVLSVCFNLLAPVVCWIGVFTLSMNLFKFDVFTIIFPSLPMGHSFQNSCQGIVECIVVLVLISSHFREHLRQFSGVNYVFQIFPHFLAFAMFSGCLRAVNW